MAAKRKKNILRVALTFLTVIVICWIFSNSLQNAEESSAKSGAVREFMQKILDVLFHGKVILSEHFVRKTAHFSEYALLGMMLYFTYRSYTSRKLFLSVPAFVAVITPFIDEGLQFFSEGRTPMFGDVCIDLSGAAIGMFLAGLVFYVIIKQRMRLTQKNKKSPS